MQMKKDNIILVDNDIVKEINYFNIFYNIKISFLYKFILINFI